MPWLSHNDDMMQSGVMRRGRIGPFPVVFAIKERERDRQIVRQREREEKKFLD